MPNPTKITIGFTEAELTALASHLNGEHLAGYEKQNLNRASKKVRKAWREYCIYLNTPSQEGDL